MHFYGDVALAFDVTSELLGCVAKSKGWQELQDEVCRLELKAQEFRELMKSRHVADGAPWGLARHLAERVNWMIDTMGPKPAVNTRFPAANKSAISPCLAQWTKSLITAQTNGWLSAAVTPAPRRVPGNTSASGSSTSSTGRTGTSSSSSSSSGISSSSGSSRRTVSFAPRSRLSLGPGCRRRAYISSFLCVSSSCMCTGWSCISPREGSLRLVGRVLIRGTELLFERAPPGVTDHLCH